MIEFEKIRDSDEQEIKFADIVIKLEIKQVEKDGKNIGLTGMEFALFYYLVKNKNKPVNRNELLDKIWGFENEVETRAPDDMIKRIRKKLTESGSILRIETIWGIGFKIEGKE